MLVSRGLSSVGSRFGPFQHCVSGAELVSGPFGPFRVSSLGSMISRPQHFVRSIHHEFLVQNTLPCFNSNGLYIYVYILHFFTNLKVSSQSVSAKHWRFLLCFSALTTTNLFSDSDNFMDLRSLTFQFIALTSFDELEEDVIVPRSAERSSYLSKKYPTGPTERTPKPWYLITLAT